MLIVTVLVMVGTALEGGQAQAASPRFGPPSCVHVTPTIGVYPTVIGNAQLPATFTTDDRYFAGRGTYYDAYTLDCAPLKVTPVTVGSNTDVSFAGDSTLSCGPHYFDDTYYAGSPTPDQEFAGTFFVSCITADPSTIISTQQPIQITLTGSEFFQDSNMFAVDVDGTPVSTTPSFNNTTVTTSFTAQGLACATHTITLSEKMGGMPLISANTTLTVQCPTSSSPPPPPPPGNAKITVDPVVVPDGMLTHVTGTGFNPGAPVTVTWQDPKGTVLDGCSATALNPAPLNADASGKIDVYCLALPHESIGAEQIAADQPAGNSVPVQHATAPVVVENGSMQPSNGDQLIFRR